MELSCPLGLRALSRKYTDHALVFFSHIINPLLIVLARSKWLDIGVVLFLRTFRALALRQSESSHSDEGRTGTLETEVFESFTVANLPYRPSG